ncbi:MAG: AmmeMemoRadiSam system protein B [gamma proteobacterium symbiont of Bathyaustriella thionipta]|nr:AmmeMemoRadiSam system protein B [gamma proteobacterium symbiont of Bathyaustriella thionipta]
MHYIRPPAVAGTFYPDQPQVLQQQVDHLLSSARQTARSAPKALIVPHAGYIYSGSVAASAYALLEKHPFSQVVLFGPAHRLPFHGVALCEAEAYETPLGRIAVNRQQEAALNQLDFSRPFDLALAPEHCLEVQLPFLQRLKKDFSIIPLLAGECTPQQAEAALEACWGGPETLIIISSDLSHYLDYNSARNTDEKTINSILALDEEAISYQQACGQIPIRGLLRVARKKHMRIELLDARNSGDTAGSKDRVVGYAAFALYEDEL